MRFLPTRLHGILDYVYGLLLVAAPKIFGFNVLRIPDVTGAVGIIVIGYSLFTSYELSLYKGIPMKTHLVFDFIIGVFLIASPWLFHFSDRVYLPHVLFGAFAIVASLITKTGTHITAPTK